MPVAAGALYWNRWLPGANLSRERIYIVSLDTCSACVHAMYLRLPNGIEGTIESQFKLSLVFHARCLVDKCRERVVCALIFRFLSKVSLAFILLRLLPFDSMETVVILAFKFNLRRS